MCVHSVMYVCMCVYVRMCVCMYFVYFVGGGDFCLFCWGGGCLFCYVSLFIIIMIVWPHLLCQNTGYSLM